MENVQSITNTAIEVDEGDRDLLRSAMEAVVEGQNLLGMELERHLSTVAHLHGSLSQARADYRSLVEVLAKKYVKRPGRFDFRPELGAFVETRD